MHRISITTLLSLLLTLALATSCNPFTQQANTNVNGIQTGDLIFVVLPVGYGADSVDIAAGNQYDSTEALIAHVAIAERVGDSLYVIDATLAHGVDCHPIDTLFATFTLGDGRQPRYDLYRLIDTTGVHQFIKNAKRYCGQAYDVTFDLTTKEQYCSELVRNSYVLNGDTLFGTSPMDFCASNGAVAPLWRHLFGLLNTPIPQGVTGILPSDILKDEHLELVMPDWRH